MRTLKEVLYSNALKEKSEIVFIDGQCVKNRNGNVDSITVKEALASKNSVLIQNNRNIKIYTTDKNDYELRKIINNDELLRNLFLAKVITLIKKKETLGQRMKGYENLYRNKLPKKSPVIIRIDGKAFHTYTKGFEKPYDEKLARAFWETAKYLCGNISGCKLAYHQSDEISLLITDYDKLTTNAWYDNNIQKMVSVAASMATMAFNKAIESDKPALFDARAFVIPEEDVNNYFLWRQRDAIKNSISMLAQHHFSQKELNGLNSSQLKAKLIEEKSVDWNELNLWKKSGLCITKEYYYKRGALRSKWSQDIATPLFSRDREYIYSFIKK